MKKLLIIDSNSILNRAYYGIRHLSAKDGTPTNAVYGFLNILLKLISDIDPEYMCAAFDVKAPTFRHKQFDEYKAHRKPMPDDLAVQLPITKDILSAMGIPVLEKEGYEADDIIGTVSGICEKNSIKCFIATGDKDDLQLASVNTNVILTVTRSGVNETTVYDADAVIEKYGVTPSEFIDVKALMGDASDNIPGVAGIGEKTAFSLISKFKSIEYIYDNIDSLGLKGAMLKKVTDGRDMAFLSKQLATIDRNVPLDFDISACNFSKDKMSEDGNGALFDILNRLGLASIIKRLELVPKPDTSEAEMLDIFEDMKPVSVDSGTALSDMAESIKKQGGFALISEISGHELTGIFAAVGNTVYHAVKRLISDFDSIILPLLADETVKKTVYDIKSASAALAETAPIKGIDYDVCISVYLINPARSSYDIDSIAAEYLGVEIAKENAQMSLFDEAQDTSDINFKRAFCLPKLRAVSEKLLEDNGQMRLYYDVELPLIEVLADMQRFGFMIDKTHLLEFSKQLSEQIDKLSEQIYGFAGETFNINSPKQLGAIIFEKLGLKSVKKTKTGYSTNAEVLERLQEEHPIIGCIMEYRTLTKLKNTYCDGLNAVINPQTGRIHSVFNQTVTVTGRISSSEPNMQNIPTRTPLGRELRKMFVAADGYVLVDADYSQIELRVLAHIADDKAMQDAFLSGADIHTATAAQILGIPPESVTSAQRSSAKAVNFGIVYGIGEFSLSQDLHIPVAEAREYIKNYLDKYSGVRGYMESIKEQAKKDGYVKTLMNRIRYIPELKSSNFNVRSFGERVALNTPIQGFAADIIKLAMVRVHRRLKENNMKSRLILQVHDELIVEAYIPEKEQVKEILRAEMENAVQLKVPLIADMSEGHSWYDAK